MPLMEEANEQEMCARRARQKWACAVCYRPQETRVRMTRSSVTIQITPEARPSTPSWMGEVTAFAQVLTHTGILKKIQEQVRFARARFGTYDLIDFAVVLIGYVLSGEPTLLDFYERLAPFAGPFMALFGRSQLPHRSTLSRFLAALDQPTVQALRTCFHENMLARTPFASPGGLFDRTGAQWTVVDVDGTRQVARQRALPQTDTLPAPHRRFDLVCAPGYQGRKRGEVVRSRTVIFQAHTHQFLGTFGGSGNGDYRGELRRAIQVITSYATHLGLPTASILLRLDGLYGDATPLLDVLSADLGVIARSRAYHLLDLDIVQQCLLRAPDHVSTHPESGMVRALYDCPAVPLTSTGPEVRLVVATHDATSSSPAVGVERDGTIYELFVSTFPSPAFTASDVLDLYLHMATPALTAKAQRKPAMRAVASVYPELFRMAVEEASIMSSSARPRAVPSCAAILSSPAIRPCSAALTWAIPALVAATEATPKPKPSTRNPGRRACQYPSLTES